jgi:hypothetical protein
MIGNSSANKLRPYLRFCSRFIQPLMYKTLTWGHVKSAVALHNAHADATTCPRKPISHIQSREMLLFYTIRGKARLNGLFFMYLIHYCAARNLSKCFSTARLESMNLSTQFCMQLSSLPASLPDDIEPVMHFLKQVSVSSWTAAGKAC